MRKTFITILIKGLIAQSLIIPSASANTANTATLSGPVGCPFTQDVNQDANASVNALRANLSRLANSKGCGNQTATTAQSLQNLLDTALNTYLPAKSGVDIYGRTILTCDNYQGILNQEYDLVLQTIDNSYFMPGNDFLPRYRTCTLYLDETYVPADPDLLGISPRERFLFCAKEVRDQTLYAKIEECSLTETIEETNRKNQAIREQIMQITQLTTNIIMNTDTECDKDVLQSIAQSAISVLTTVGAVSVGAGIPAAGIALGGSIVSALVDRFFGNRGKAEEAKRYLSRMDNNNLRNDLACTYYQVQSYALNCSSLTNNVKEEADALNKVVTLGCFDIENDFIKPIGDLARFVRAITRQGGTAQDPTIPQSEAARGDSIRRLLESTVQDPHVAPNERTSVVDYLRKVADTLDNNSVKSLSDRNQGKRIRNIIEAYDNFKTLEADDASDLAALNTANSKLVSSFNDPQAGAIDVTEAVRTYYRHKNVSNPQTTLGRIAAHEYPSPTFSMTSVVDQNIYESHNAMVSLYQEYFNEELTQLQDRYDKNKITNKNDSAYQGNMDHLTPLLKTCVLNAGMFYYEKTTDNRDSVNLVSDKPSQAYNKTCSMFMCDTEPLLPKFEPESGPNADSVETQFKRYQCALNAQYSQIRQKFESNYRNHKQICAPKEEPPRPEPEMSKSTITEELEAAVDGSYKPVKGGKAEKKGFFASIWSGITGIFDFLFGWMF